MDAHLDPGAASRAIGFQEHLGFFDEDGDQRLAVGEVRRGLERLGFGSLLAVPAAVGINVGVAGLGLLQGLPVVPWDLDRERTGFVRHPDSDLVDDGGVFDDAKLRSVFDRYGRTFGGEAVTVPELVVLLAGRVLGDARTAAELLLLPVGFTAATVEWAALLWLAGSARDGRPVLERETVRRFYTDSEFFDDVAQRVAAERARRSESFLGRLRNMVQDWIA